MIGWCVSLQWEISEKSTVIQKWKGSFSQCEIFILREHTRAQSAVRKKYFFMQNITSKKRKNHRPVSMTLMSENMKLVAQYKVDNFIYFVINTDTLSTCLYWRFPADCKCDWRWKYQFHNFIFIHAKNSINLYFKKPVCMKKWYENDKKEKKRGVI